MDDALMERIIAERQAGAGLWDIARGLDRDGVPTRQQRGTRRWRAGTIAYLLRRALGDRTPVELAELLGLEHRRRPGTGGACNPRSLSVQRFRRRHVHPWDDRVLMVKCMDCGAAATIADPGGSVPAPRRSVRARPRVQHQVWA
jgi:hypothetical protein